MNTADEFLATGGKFRLGFLETEKPHPKTLELSDLAQSNISKAIQIMSEIDVEALEKLKLKTKELVLMREQIISVWKNGGRIYLCGCGATGRLSLSLETLYREQMRAQHPDQPELQNRVIGFMAGGDVALVHSLEGFEDFPDYGERHLRELGFRENDLLISSTEGGETPYVIGATEAASRISHVPPYFLYCNPDEVLVPNVERSRRVIENPKINKINLAVGPMALAGSTRMQASTVLQLGIGLALLTDLNDTSMQNFISNLQKYLSENAVPFLNKFVEIEADEYLAERYILYRVQNYAITVFTDTTERAPTFSLTPFSHRKAERLLKLKPSKCFISLVGAKTPDEAFQHLLLRSPRVLNWGEIDARTEQNYLREFDFSDAAMDFRNWLTNGTEHSYFEIFRNKNCLIWRLQGEEAALSWPEDSHILFEHMLLKMFLNIHSTLVMGRYGRYKRNLMTWVHPTNGKLIDRASRYVQTLLHEDGIDVSYDKVVRTLFEVKNKITANDSVVLATYEALK